MRDIEATLENDSFERYFAEEVTLGTEMQHFEYVFTMDTTDVVTLKFLVALQQRKMPLPSRGNDRNTELSA